MDYKQAEEYLFSYTDYENMPMPHDPAFYDLRRVEELLARLGNPHLAARSVHIAGTKGKGSVAAMIASVLSVSSYTTGLYTSPHLHTWRERMRVNGELISAAEFVNLMSRLKLEVEVVNQKATYGQLTTFELLTALGFTFFKSKKAEFQVLEVGMGGKFDATNVIQPEVAVITSISLDHTDVLGDSPARIAGEKAGIIKSGSTVVSASQIDEVARVIEDACRSQGARLIRVGRDVTGQGSSFDTSEQRLEVKGRRRNYPLSIPLLGQYQVENAAVAVAALEVLAEKGFHISRESIINGLGRVSWPGRFQIVGRQPLVVMDGAHNPASARQLRQSLAQYFGLTASGVKRSLQPAILVIGVSCDKDIAGIAAELAPLFDKVIATRSRHPRAMAVAPITAEFAKYGVEVPIAGDVPTALRLALSLAGEKGMVCVAGSLFVVGEAIAPAEVIKPELPSPSP